jgi:hypothetical protein
MVREQVVARFAEAVAEGGVGEGSVVRAGGGAVDEVLTGGCGGGWVGSDEDGGCGSLGYVLEVEAAVAQAVEDPGREADRALEGRWWPAAQWCGDSCSADAAGVQRVRCRAGALQAVGEIPRVHDVRQLRVTVCLSPCVRASAPAQVVEQDALGGCIAMHSGAHQGDPAAGGDDSIQKLLDEQGVAEVLYGERFSIPWTR